MFALIPLTNYMMGPKSAQESATQWCGFRKQRHYSHFCKKYTCNSWRVSIATWWKNKNLGLLTLNPLFSKLHLNLFHWTGVSNTTLLTTKPYSENSATLEVNYRGDLDFLSPSWCCHQALATKDSLSVCRPPYCHVNIQSLFCHV